MIYRSKQTDNRNQFHCYHNNTGFCKYGEECHYQHYHELCGRTICKQEKCKYRHPKSCKFAGKCQFYIQKRCVYRHDLPNQKDSIEIESMTKEVQVFKEQVEKLKVEIADLKNDIQIREKELEENSAKHSEALKKLIDENKFLKESLDLHTISESSTIYYCNKCDFNFDEEDCLESHKELYHENLCEKCDLNFDEEDDLTMHNKQNHMNRCTICDYESTTQKGLKIHIGAKHK